MNTEIKLDPRRPGMGILHVGVYEIGDKIDLHDQPIKVGQSVTLHSGPVYVIATITAVDGKALKGEITGFEKIKESEYCGRRAGDAIDFTAADIHGIVH